VATYRLSAKTIGRTAGRSATGAAAYRAAERIEDRRTGIVHDYTRRGGVVHSEILAPADAPAWIADRTELWNRVEDVERRKDAQLCREVLLSLPHELDDARRLELVRGFVREQFVARGMVADVAIHRAHERSDARNHHAHILLTMRALEREGFGPKVRDWNDTALLVGWREAWERDVNRELQRAHIPERVSSRSLAARGIDLEPEPRQGPVATRMERLGRTSHAGNDRRAARARNAERAALREERGRIEAELRDEERRRTAARDQVDRPSAPRDATPNSRSAAREAEPGFSRADAPDWQVSREQILSALYERNLRGSRLARYWRIERTAQGIAFENAGGRFEDRGDRIHASHGNGLEIRGMLDVAGVKGWGSLVITGSEDFKRRGMIAALERGFAVQAEGRDAELLREVDESLRAADRDRVRGPRAYEGWTR
jgi:hypothetical protein